MSLNTVYQNDHLIELEVLQGLLDGILPDWKNASTLERRDLIESRILGSLQSIVDNSFVLEDISALKPFDMEHFVAHMQQENLITQSTLAGLLKLSELYTRYYNSQKILVASLVSKLRRIRQKQAVLKLWGKSASKHVIAEKFLNLDSLSFEHTSSTPCDLEPSQGILTLPIQQAEQVRVKKFSILKGSNGIPGNSNVSVRNTSNIRYLSDGSLDTWFEYERLDSGPLQLNLGVEFDSEQIVNHIHLDLMASADSLPFDIEDILFTDPTGSNVSIKELTLAEDGFFSTESVGNDTAWKISFVPVRTKNVVLKFKQTDSHIISMATGQKKQIARKRFSIALKELSFYRLRYAKEGGINSIDLSIPKGLYACNPVFHIAPIASNLFDTSLMVSFDSGSSWEKYSSDLLESNSILMNGEHESFLWKLKVSRNDSAFAGLFSLTEQNPQVTTDSLLRTVSRYSSPAEINLPKKPIQNRTFVIQPQVIKRSRTEYTKIGDGQASELAFDLPIDLVSTDVNFDDLIVRVNRQIWSRKAIHESLSYNNWKYSEDYKQILFSEDLPNGALVEIRIAPEEMFFEERADGFYHKTEMFFDPDKENITIQSLPRKGKRMSRLLPKGQTVIRLSESLIDPDDFVLVSRDGVAYNRVENLGEVLDNADHDYLVDYENGILYLASPITTDAVRVSYKSFSPKILPQEAFDVVFKDNRPWGIKINKGHFFAETATEFVGENISKRFDPKSYTKEKKEDILAGNPKAKILSANNLVKGTVRVKDLLANGRVPKEVPYIDGESEFLGLKSVSSESTIEIESGLSDTVSFALAAGGLWYSRFPVVFSDTTIFANQMASIASVLNPGDYFISNEGIVTVFVGAGNALPADIEIQYSYIDPNFNSSNLYSVDYKNGILYASEALNSSGSITYKCSSYIANYDVARELTNFSYNSNSNALSIRTENLHPVNNLIKVIWINSINDSTVEELKDYFSPIIDLVGFRFN